MKRIITLVILVTLSITGLFAFQHGMRGEGRGFMDNPERMNFREEGRFAELDLSAEQQEKINDARVKMHKAIIPIESAIKLLHIDQKEAYKNENFNSAKKVMKAIFAKKQEIAILRINHKESISKILTTEQKEKLKTLPRKFMNRNNRKGNNHGNRQNRGKQDNPCRQ